MIECNCCTPKKSYGTKKSLYRHERVANPYFIEPEARKIIEYENRKAIYFENPKRCVQCDCTLDYNMVVVEPRRKFCSHSCSAKKSSTGRKKEIYRCIYRYCKNTTSGKQYLYCCNSCKEKERWEKFKENPSSVWNSRNRKKQLLEELGPVCQSCHNTDWLGKPITLEIEHINGNSSDHNRENTTLLCPNCHSQTSTYKSKNNGNGRAIRRQRYAEGKSY